MFLIKKIIHLFHIIKSSIILTFAKNQISDGNYDEAMNLLLKVNILYRDYTFHIFQAICFGIKDLTQNSIKSYELALKNIQSNHYNAKLNDDDKNYIATYIYLGLAKEYKKILEVEKSEYYTKCSKNQNFNIQNIKRYIQYDFPIEIN